MHQGILCVKKYNNISCHGNNRLVKFTWTKEILVTLVTMNPQWINWSFKFVQAIFPSPTTFDFLPTLHTPHHPNYTQASVLSQHNSVTQDWQLFLRLYHIWHRLYIQESGWGRYEICIYSLWHWTLIWPHPPYTHSWPILISTRTVGLDRRDIIFMSSG